MAYPAGYCNDCAWTTRTYGARNRYERFCSRPGFRTRYGSALTHCHPAFDGRALPQLGTGDGSLSRCCVFIEKIKIESRSTDDQICGRTAFTNTPGSEGSFINVSILKSAKIRWMSYVSKRQ